MLKTFHIPIVAFFTSFPWPTSSDNVQCAFCYTDNRFSILVRAHSTFLFSALEATFIKFLNPIFCKQEDFGYAMKLFLAFFLLNGESLLTNESSL